MKIKSLLALILLTCALSAPCLAGEPGMPPAPAPAPASVFAPRGPMTTSVGGPGAEADPAGAVGFVVEAVTSMLTAIAAAL